MPKTENSLNDFGLLIAYLLPGFVALWGMISFDPTVQVWFGSAATTFPTLSSFLLSTIASLAVGLTIHTLRWLIIDSLHHHTGIRPKNWDFAMLQDRLAAYDRLTENHYRFYQFYGGMVLSFIWLLVVRHYKANGTWDDKDAAIVTLIIVFWLGSRDSLRKYYRRVDAVLTKASV